MKTQYRKVKKYLSLLQENIWKNITKEENLLICPCGYKEGNTPPPLSDFKPIPYGGTWGSGIDSHAWFHFTVENVNENTYLGIQTDKSGWDANNPQFIIYVNGKMKQGLDTNHREVYIGDVGATAEIYLYAYVGMQNENAKILVDTREKRPEVYGLYYDILYPFQMLDYLDVESAEYAHILYFLYKAVSKLELYDIGSDEFIDSVSEAREYLKNEFYGDYCRPQVAKSICIGHTHIDCAWQWTLDQTREKVQRSFATVLELMKQYPEYKFMSSQALLYKFLKEEAPELYAEVAERIKEGRWECEGAMWVEADCNLSSGESLIRQVVYGKRFFKDEFGVENRVLWLPDVFGYSAALPQILRKCGVEWFVTSKLSWNDYNRMPYDTFKWRGLDGTEINSQFITAQDAVRGVTKTNTTYVCKTNAQMVAGTYKRYSQKHLSDEAIITFGFGDGGGGPTAEHLELARRGAKGIPGSPEVKIDFAGDYLKRLEKKIENNPDLPVWHGELYLEKHAGTLTTMAKNKKNNRYSEFLLEDAELLATTAKSLFGDKFPKSELHAAWEDVLTNQFHDIIPGSSIKEVYDRSDKDYAKIREIGEGITDSVKSKIASCLDKNGGYAVFNPHSFCGEGFVKIDGKTALVKGIPQKGYKLTNDFVTSNSVKIEGKTVENDVIKIAFNDAWQIISIYDKKNSREVLKNGAVANEIRVYADYPDNHDAWEWNEYSRAKYKTLTAVDKVEVIDDGARRGIKTVRPFMHSKITQTVWFTDSSAQIDFETLADWHDTHKMVKAVFPVDINTDKATFEVQFGTIERPTHSNTSWDRAKFETCGHKYADISDGNYGVSLMNDCKYGHDVHDGVMMLSLLRSPTFPNPEADRGEMTFTYSLYPHAGKLCDSDTPRRAYYLNYPLAAVKATGDNNTLPAEYSAISLDVNHVICETVKEEEQGEGTVLRLYESKNICGKVTLTVGLGAKKAYLCDMLENELCELEVNDGKITLDVKGFEIITVKLK